MEFGRPMLGPEGCRARYMVIYGRLVGLSGCKVKEIFFLPMWENVVDFGVFVDIGVKQDGLIHISQMLNKFIKSPHELVSVGDTITVKVLSVDLDRKRISLTMKV